MTNSRKLPTDALTANEVRVLCYRTAASLHMVEIAVQSLDDYEFNETMQAVTFELDRLKDTLNDVGGGATFDRLEALEKAMASREISNGARYEIRDPND